MFEGTTAKARLTPINIDLPKFTCPAVGLVEHTGVIVNICKELLKTFFSVIISQDCVIKDNVM